MSALSDRISTMVFAFDANDGRRAAVHDIAADVAGIEASLALVIRERDEMRDEARALVARVVSQFIDVDEATLDDHITFARKAMKEASR